MSKTKTEKRTRIATWLDNEALAQLRAWRDTEALSIADFIRIAIEDAIAKRRASSAQPVIVSEDIITDEYEPMPETKHKLPEAIPASKLAGATRKRTRAPKPPKV